MHITFLNLALASAGVASPYILASEMPIVLRQPQRVTRAFESFGVLNSITWLFILASVVVLSLALAVIHAVYRRHLVFLLTRKDIPQSDFLIRTVSMISEPDQMPWFKRRSAGWDPQKYFYKPYHRYMVF